MKPIQNLRDLKEEIATNPQLQQEWKDDPVEASKNLPDQIPDTLIYRIVVGSLGLALILVIVASVILLFPDSASEVDTRVPTIFTAIASGAIGALAGLLAPSPRNG